MFWFTPSIVAVFWLPHVLAGQIPPINGIIGGVPTLKSNITNPIVATTVSNSVPAGQLRVVENSGVCGQPLIFSKKFPNFLHVFQKKQRPVFIRLLDMVT